MFGLQVSKKRYELKPPAPKRALQNMLQFFRLGTYNVTYPKKGASPAPAPCCSKHGKCDDKAGKLTHEHASALKMLSGIDSRMQAIEEGKGAASGRPAGSQTTYTNSALDGGVRTEPPRSAAQATAAADSSEEDDYDAEFADSALNNYHKYYFSNGDEAGEVSEGEDEKEQGVELDDEAAALLVRSRVRTDSLQLFKETTNAKNAVTAMNSNKSSSIMRINSTERM